MRHQKQKRQKHPHIQLSLNLKWTSFHVGNNHHMNLLVPSTALRQTHTDTEALAHILTHAHANGRPISTGWKRRLFWSSVSMTTFNWMVNQLLICLSTAWCGQNEGERRRGTEGENRKMRWKRKKGIERKGGKETKRGRGKSGTCVCILYLALPFTDRKTIDHDHHDGCASRKPSQIGRIKTDGTSLSPIHNL